MPQAKQVPITGSVLGWAMQEEGLTEEELARRLKVDAKVVRGWEGGEELPTVTQFRRLVQVLKRPSALFFLPEPPKQASVLVHFRAAPGAEQAVLKPEEARWLRVAKRLQEAASWVTEKLGDPPLELPFYKLLDSEDRVAHQERERVGVTLSKQESWSDAAVALREWRSVLEDRGILAFQFRLGREACRGFSLWDVRAPLIAVNSAYNEAARIFTLFHEYGHLLLRSNAVCNTPEVYAEAMREDDVERWCERFAAAFLMPKEALQEYLAVAFGWSANQSLRDFENVATIATHFKVSLRAAALRLVEIHAAEYGLYRQVSERARVQEREKRRGGGRGIPRHERRVQELGKRLPRILLTGMRREILGIHDVLDYMDVATVHLAELESLVVSG